MRPRRASCFSARDTDSRAVPISSASSLLRCRRRAKRSVRLHVVGQQFDTVYLGAPPGNAIHGVQTFGVAAGGGMVFEFMADVPGTFPFVNHAFGHGQKGAIGVLVVDEVGAEGDHGRSVAE